MRASKLLGGILGVMALAGMSAAAQPAAWTTADAQNYRLECPLGTIELSGKTAGLRLTPKDGSAANLTFFQWHDSYVYETMAAGTVEKITLVAGDLLLEGVWGTRGNAPPLRYQLTLTPTEAGLRLRLLVRKTGPLNLVAGVRGTLSLEVQDDKDRALVEPWLNTSLLDAFDTHYKLLKVGRITGKGIAIVVPDYCSARITSSGKGRKNLEFGMTTDKDFPENSSLELNAELSFITMPTTYPVFRADMAAPLSLTATAPTTVTQYRKCEIEVDLRGTWDNPFDPQDVSLDAEASCSWGQSYVLPGFFMQPYAMERIDGHEAFYPEGAACWKVRLVGLGLGEMRVKLVARDRSGRVEYALPAPIRVVAGKERGFVRQSRIDPYYFIHDNGESYVPIGHNVPLYRPGPYGETKALEVMAAHGENWNRWWMSSHGFGLEWERQLGCYRQKQSAQLDYVLDLAEDLDMYYMICMDTHQDFRNPGWKGNPYNSANGGPCAQVVDWFTNEEAKSFYRQRLRYIVARWAYSQRIMCWEFGNEFEGWAGSPAETVIEWHREMAPFLAALDPYNHLISTSWWSKTGPVACWKIPEMDIVQTHCYTNDDMNVAVPTIRYCQTQRANHAKPHLFAEFGIRSHASTADKDPEGWHLHNSGWAAICSGCNGNPMPWWHENYIAPNNLHFHFQALRNFVGGLPFGREVWRPLTIRKPEIPPSKAEPGANDVVIKTVAGFRKAAVADFSIAEDGAINDGQELLATLQGEGHRDKRTFPTFQVNYPVDGQFKLKIDTVSNSGHLKIYIDDELALERELPCGEGIGKSSKWQKQWQLWQCEYDEELSIPVAAGQRRIRVENHGKDWIRIPYFVFTGCRQIVHRDVICAGMACDSVAIVWLQNDASSWLNHARKQVSPLPAASYGVEVRKDGRYRVEWWETWKGSVSHTQEVTARDGVLLLEPGPLATDVAAKIFPMR
jgi:hypothetical protein